MTNPKFKEVMESYSFKYIVRQFKRKKYNKKQHFLYNFIEVCIDEKELQEKTTTFAEVAKDEYSNKVDLNFIEATNIKSIVFHQKTFNIQFKRPVPNAITNTPLITYLVKIRQL